MHLSASVTCADSLCHAMRHFLSKVKQVTRRRRAASRDDAHTKPYYLLKSQDMGVSINGATPKCGVYKGKSHRSKRMMTGGSPMTQETSILGCTKFVHLVPKMARLWLQAVNSSRLPQLYLARWKMVIPPWEIRNFSGICGRSWKFLPQSKCDCIPIYHMIVCNYVYLWYIHVYDVYRW